MTSIIDSLSTMIAEELPAVMIESLPETDPIYKSVFRTSQEVKSSEIGRNWEVKHRFRTSMSGQILGDNIERDSIASGGYKGVLRYGTLSSFPKPEYTPHVGSAVRTIQLTCSRGNFSLPTHVLKAEALNSTVIKDVADDLRALGEHRAQLEAVSFYMNSSGYICTFDDGTFFNEGVADDTLRITPDSSRIRWFKGGQMVDIGDDASFTNLLNYTTAAGDTPLVVDRVDYLSNYVYLKSLDTTNVDLNAGLHGSTNLASGTYYVFPAQYLPDTSPGAVYRAGHFGLDNWIAASGQPMSATMQERHATSAAAFSYANFPQFKSVLTTVSAPLTDTVLDENIGKFIDAYGNSLDTIITTRKVTQKYLQQSTLGINRFNYERTGRALDVKGGWVSVSYEYEGQVFEWVISPYCQTGCLYVIKTREGNLKRYVPPRAAGVGGIGSPGTGPSMGMDGEIEFIAPMGGSNSIFKIAHDTNGRTTPMVEAPFEQYSQLIPVDIRGIKLSSLTESN